MRLGDDVREDVGDEAEHDEGVILSAWMMED